MNNFLNKDIDEIERTFQIEKFENMYLLSDFKCDFVATTLRKVILLVDENNKVAKIVSGYKTNEISDYSRFIEKFGKPTKIFKSGVSYFEKTETDDGLTVKEFKNRLTECTIDENPSVIIWELDGFILTITLINEKVELAFESLMNSENDMRKL